MNLDHPIVAPAITARWGRRWSRDSQHMMQAGEILMPQCSASPWSLVLGHCRDPVRPLPGIRTFSDETTVQSAKDSASNAWIVAHALDMLGAQMSGRGRWQ
jgi:hypothetical protein